MQRELLTFLLVGATATLAHIVTAILAEAALGLPPQGANLAGYLTAVGLSYAGHAHFTFRVRGNHTTHLPRFLTISLAGLFIGAAVVSYFETRQNVPFAAAMVVVGAVVATATFLLSKFWAFASGPHKDAG